MHTWRLSRRARIWRRLTANLLAIVLVVSTVLTATAAPPSAAVPAGGMPADDINAMFRDYGNAGSHWTGADGTTSVLLPDGRLVWLFSDTFLGSVNADLSRPSGTPMVNNSMVVQEGTRLVDTRFRGSSRAPIALVTPMQDSEFFWVADGLVEAGALKVLYNRYRRVGIGPLDFALTGTSLATFVLPELTLQSVVDLPVGSLVSWGSAMLADSDYTYIYGTSSAPGRMKFGHLARAVAGDLGGIWQFWTGSAWSSVESDAGRLLSGVGTNFGVQKVDNQYMLVTQENNLVFDPQIVAYTAPSPAGPFSGPIYLLTAPEPAPGKQIIVYAARLHPELARPGKLLLSYDVNSLDFADTLADVRLYRPRFVEIGWPLPAPAPDRPTAPAGLTATAHDDTGQISWTAVAGATAYRLYQRDTTAGQTHFARYTSTVTQTTQQVGLLITGHRYEFRVAAINAAGEGDASAAVSVTPVSTKSAAEVIRFAGSPDAVAESYIVQVKASSAPSEETLSAFARQLTTEYGGQLSDLYPLTLNGFSVTMSEQQAINLASHPDVLNVEQDQKYSTLSVDQNPQYSTLGEQLDPPWNLDRIDQRELPLDHRYVYPNSGEGVRVYVIDSGIRASHAQFGGRVVQGYNVIDRNTDTDDCFYHGTHMAGVIGGATYGVAKAVELVPVKVTDCFGDTFGRDIAAGIEWATQDARAQGKPAVMNISLGWNIYDIRAGAIDDAARKAVASGVTVVAAAGNNGMDACGISPAHLREAITVAATGQDDARHRQSNYGSCVDIFAPGVGVASAAISTQKRSAPDDCKPNPQGDQSDTATCVDSGTSQAAAHVSGAVAIILTAHPEYNPAEVEAALKAAATRGVVVDPQTTDPLLLYIERPPTHAPANLTAMSNADGTIALRWEAVPEEGVHYLVWSRDVTGGESEFRQWDTPVFSGTSTIARNLFEGHQYEFVVAAANTAGTGPQSAPASAVSHTAPPPAPTGLAAASNPDGTIGLSWSSLGPDIWYWVYMRDVTAQEESFTRLEFPITTGSSMTAAYLTHNHTYEFKVSGINQGGEGPASAPARAVSRYPTPGAPSQLTATAQSDGTIRLTWTAPGDNLWFEIYQRDVTAGESDFTKLGLPVTTCCTFSAGLLTHNHTYEFKVAATNAAGAGPQSAVARATAHYEPPPAPGNLRGRAAGDGSIDLDWDPPGSGGFYYWIYQRDVTAGQTAFTKLTYPTEQTTVSIGLLVHGHVYEYKVSASNQGGEGSASSPVRITARGGLPAAPSRLTATARNGEVDLRWTASATPGVLYTVYQRNASANQSWQKLSLPVNGTTMTAGFLANGSTYEFKVTAWNAAGESAASNVVSARPMPPLPRPPTNLSATPGDGQATLRWTASSTSNVYYWVEMRSNGGSWQRLQYPLSTCCSFTLDLLSNGTTYEFRLRATNISGDSEPSNVASARPWPPIPNPPSNLRASGGKNDAMLYWSPSSTPRVLYRVYMRDAGAGGAWSTAGQYIATSFYRVPFLHGGHLYEFRVTAENLAGESAPSNTAGARLIYLQAEIYCDLNGPTEILITGLAWGWAPFSSTVHVTRMLFWNGRLWMPPKEDWIPIDDDGFWTVSRGIGGEGAPGRYDLYVLAEGPRGEDWGYMHVQCVAWRPIFG